MHAHSLSRCNLDRTEKPPAICIQRKRRGEQSNRWASAQAEGPHASPSSGGREVGSRRRGLCACPACTHTHTHTSQFICSAVPCPCRVGAMWPYVAQMEAHWAEVRWLWVLWFLSPSLQAGIWPCFTPTALEQAPCQTQH